MDLVVRMMQRRRLWPQCEWVSAGLSSCFSLWKRTVISSLSEVSFDEVSNPDSVFIPNSPFALSLQEFSRFNIRWALYAISYKGYKFDNNKFWSVSFPFARSLAQKTVPLRFCPSTPLRKYRHNLTCSFFLIALILPSPVRLFRSSWRRFRRWKGKRCRRRSSIRSDHECCHDFRQVPRRHFDEASSQENSFQSIDDCRRRQWYYLWYQWVSFHNHFELHNHSAVGNAIDSESELTRKTASRLTSIFSAFFVSSSRPLIQLCSYSWS